MDETDRQLLFTEDFKETLRWMDVTWEEWQAMRDEIVRIAFLKYPKADECVCRVQCCKNVGETDLYRLKLRQLRMRVFFTYDAKTMTFWFALRRSDNTYAMVELMWQAQWATR